MLLRLLLMKSRYRTDIVLIPEARIKSNAIRTHLLKSSIINAIALFLTEASIVRSVRVGI